MVVMARLKSRLLVSSRSCLSEPAELRVLYNKELVFDQQFKVQSFTSGVPIVQAVQVVQIVHDGNTFYTACEDFRTYHRGGNEDAESEKFQFRNSNCENFVCALGSLR